MEKNKISILKDKAFYIPIIILIIYFIIRLIDQSKIMWMFPFDSTNDISSHMAKIFFLAKYGYHQLVPYWYNGYMLFKLYPPAWFYFSLPLYYLTQNVQITTFTSMILMYLIGFIFFYYFGNLVKLSNIKKIVFFLFFFVNPISIGNFIRVGKLPEMFAWLMLIPFAFIILSYKDRIINKKFFIIILFYSIMLVSHQTVFLISNFLLLSLFLIKNNKKERILILLPLVISAIITSAWWVPFIKNSLETNMLNYVFSARLLIPSGQLLLENIASFVIPLIFLGSFYFYWKSKNKSKKELLFFLPETILAILFLSRITSFIPILNSLYPDTYNHFLFFISVFMILKTKFIVKIRKYFSIILIAITLLGIFLSINYTPWFIENNNYDKETISLFPYITENFIILENKVSYAKAFYSYAPIYYNLSTSSGWSHQEVESSYLTSLHEISAFFKEGNCKNFLESLEKTNTKFVITYNSDCEKLEECNLKEIDKKEHACLFSN
ncbi:MAG: hypothetical protein ISS82_04570 [Nanoarchaeota archaeon]|nr:hypothetical protein [Nanoarchaeota archaeon]